MPSPNVVEVCREFIACGWTFRYYRVTYLVPDGSTFERIETVELPALLPQQKTPPFPATLDLKD